MTDYYLTDYDWLFFFSLRLILLKWNSIRSMIYKIGFYKNKGDIVKFHFDLSNCMHLIIEDYQQGSFYCFCNKIKKKFSLCKMQSAFEKEKNIGLERLLVFQRNIEMLKKIANKIFPFLKECFELDSWSLDFLINNICGLVVVEMELIAT